jgi:hypothetical protein
VWVAWPSDQNFVVPSHLGHFFVPPQVVHALIRSPPQARSTPAARAAEASTSSSMAGVSRPVKVFCWLTW